MKSLTVDINESQVRRCALSAPHETLVEAWQEQAFHESEVVKSATKLGEADGLRTLRKFGIRFLRDVRQVRVTKFES